MVALEKELDVLTKRVAELEKEVKELHKSVLVLEVRETQRFGIITWLSRNWWTLVMAAGMLLEAWLVKK